LVQRTVLPPVLAMARAFTTGQFDPALVAVTTIVVALYASPVTLGCLAVVFLIFREARLFGV
jgi:hypothetical protein